MKRLSVYLLWQDQILNYRINQGNIASCVKEKFMKPFTLLTHTGQIGIQQMEKLSV